MREILSASYVCRVLSCFFAWLGDQWRCSRLRIWFTREGKGRAISESSVFTRFWNWLHAAVCHIFDKIGLTRALEGSVFRRSFFWLTLTAVLTPLLPTKAVIVLSLVAIISVLLNFACDPGKRLHYAPVNKFIYLYAFTYLIATVFSVTFSGSLFTGALFIIFSLFALITMNAFSNAVQLERAVKLMVLGGFFVALYGCYQYVFGAGGDKSWVDTEMFSNIGTRVYSTLQNPNVLSEYLLLIIPFSAACLLSGKNAFSRFIYLVILAVLLVCMVLTSSRGGWLGLLLAAAIFLVLLDWRLIFVGIAVLIVLYFAMPDSVIGRFTSIGNLGDSSTSYRVAIWMGSLAMLKDYWLCGVGPGTAAYNQIYPYYSYNTASAQHSHNLFLQITCDAGIAALVVFLLIVFFYYKATCGAFSREKDRRKRYYLIASISSVSGFMVQSMTDFSFYNYRVMLFFWIVVGIGMLFATGFSQKEAGHIERS